MGHQKWAFLAMKGQISQPESNKLQPGQQILAQYEHSRH